jgi:hypothetical protein
MDRIRGFQMKTLGTCLQNKAGAEQFNLCAASYNEVCITMRVQNESAPITCRMADEQTPYHHCGP